MSYPKRYVPKRLTKKDNIINLIVVACFYSNRYKGSENFVINECDDLTKNGLYSSRNHGNKKRQRNYYNRHSGEKNRKKAIEKEKRKGNGYYTPKLLSHIYLW